MDETSKAQNSLFHLQSIELLGYPNLFRDLDWEFKAGEFWTVFGKSGSGKTLLKNILCSNIPIIKHGPEHFKPKGTMTVAEVSVEQERILLDRERHEDDSAFIEGGYDPGRSAGDIIYEHLNPTFLDLEAWIERLNLKDLLSTSFKSLSNGETRKVLFCRGLAQKPELLLLDSPFEGLDAPTRAIFKEVLDELRGRQSLVLFVQNHEFIDTDSDAFLLLEPPSPPKVQGHLSGLISSEVVAKSVPPISLDIHQLPKSDPLVDIKDLNIRYGDQFVFSGFHWSMKPGENWLFTGPNGAGKTTLLQVIHADHPQSYGQNIQLFGYRRGTGETIWDIKAHVGFVSADFQRNFPLGMTGLALVVSGFQDSMGVHQKPTGTQLITSRQWLCHLGIAHLGSRYCSSMSWGELRQLMIVRAMVKKPNLLILDEPCQGLDDIQKQMILDLVEKCCENFAINFIYVSHESEITLKGVSHHLEWLPGESRPLKHRVSNC